jgi:hypothetical protein
MRSDQIQFEEVQLCRGGMSAHFALVSGAEIAYFLLSLKGWAALCYSQKKN